MNPPQTTNIEALNNLYAAASLAPLNAQQHARLLKDAQQLAEVLKPQEAQANPIDK